MHSFFSLIKVLVLKRINSFTYLLTSIPLNSKISGMLAPTFYAGSALVPGQGWLIYGGMYTNLTAAQQLKSLDDQWETGPALFGGKPDRNNCVVQVNL